MKQRKYHNETEPKQTKAYEDNVGYIHERHMQREAK